MNLSGHSQTAYFDPIPVRDVRVRVMGPFRSAHAVVRGKDLGVTREGDYATFQLPSLDEYELVELRDADPAPGRLPSRHPKGPCASVRRHRRAQGDHSTLRSIRPKRARMPAMLTLWEAPSQAQPIPNAAIAAAAPAIAVERPKPTTSSSVGWTSVPLGRKEGGRCQCHRHEP